MKSLGSVRLLSEFKISLACAAAGSITKKHNNEKNKFYGTKLTKSLDHTQEQISNEMNASQYCITTHWMIALPVSN